MRGKLFQRLIRNVLGVGIFVLSSLSLAASSISYQVEDVPDLILGEDRWQYAYQLAAGLPAFHSFEIVFDGDHVVSLDPMPAAPNADWFVSTVQPVPVIPADGLYTGLALRSDASVDVLFLVSFTWAGPGVPGAQSFSILDDAFRLLESGTTVPVPEPRIYVLMGIGLSLVYLGIRRRRR